MMTRTRCYCGLPKVHDGKCEYDCPVFADPDWLRLQAEKRREREAHRRREERIYITQDDLRRIRKAVQKFDPIAAHMAKQARRAARARYGFGGGR